MTKERNEKIGKYRILSQDTAFVLILTSGFVKIELVRKRGGV